MIVVSWAGVGEYLLFVEGRNQILNISFLNFSLSWKNIKVRSSLIYHKIIFSVLLCVLPAFLVSFPYGLRLNCLGIYAENLSLYIYYSWGLARFWFSASQICNYLIAVRHIKIQITTFKIQFITNLNNLTCLIRFSGLLEDHLGFLLCCK